MIQSSNSETPCRFCKVGLDQLCLKPQPQEYEQVSELYTCAGHKLLKFHISGNLVRGIAALLNRSSSKKN